MGKLRGHALGNILLASAFASFFICPISGLYASSPDNFNSDERQNERFVPFQVVSFQVDLNVGETSGIGIEVQEKAKEHHTRFPFFALHSQDLARIIDYAQPFNSYSLEKSYELAWEELMRRRTSSLDADSRAGAKLGLAKLIMDRRYVPKNMSEQECYSFVYDCLSQVIHTPSNIEQRKRSHARIWQAMMITKLNLKLKDKNREQSLQYSWDLLARAYKDHATDATLVFMAELIIRYRLRPNNCSIKEAFEKVKELFNKIGERNNKKIVHSFLSSKTEDVSGCKDKWRLARSAFLIDVKKTLQELDNELSKLEKDYQNNPNFEFNPLQHQPEMDKIEKEEEDKEDQQNNSDRQILPLEVSNVLNLIDPHNPDLIRAFEPTNGTYTFFNEYDVSGIGNNCGFNCLGVSREQAQQLLLNNSSSQRIRTFVASQFCRDLLVINHSSTPLLNMVRKLPIFQKLSQLNIINALTHNVKGILNNGGPVAQQFVSNEQVYRDYITHALSGNRMLEYQPQQTSIIDALAEILNLNLEIWTIAAASHFPETSTDQRFRDTLELRHQFQALNSTRTLQLRHMTQDTDGIDHFRVILPVNRITDNQERIESQTISTTLNISSDEEGLIFDEESDLSFDDEANRLKKKRSFEEFEDQEDTEVEGWYSKKRKISEEEKQRIYALYQQGKSNEEITTKTKISIGGVARVLRAYGVHKKPQCRKRLDKEQKKQIDLLTPKIKKYDQITAEITRKVAHQVNCGPRQIDLYLRNRIRGKVKPLSREQKERIISLAFEKKKIRGAVINIRNKKVSVTAITKQLGQGVVVYQVENYVRSLLRQEGYQLPASDSSSDSE